MFHNLFFKPLRYDLSDVGRAKLNAKLQINCSDDITYLRKEDLPPGRLIVSVRRHLTSVIDGVLNDTWDCSQDGNKGVYGYYYKEEK